MPSSKFERMLQLVDEVFSTRNDPSQLQVDETVIQQLQQLHPATVSEHDDDGPAAWVLLIPTSEALMNRFLDDEISEQELLDLNAPGTKFEAIYLCSASVLPEYRRKGIALQLTLDAIEKIRKDHPIKTLYVWPFTKEGDALANLLAEKTGLPLKSKLK